MQNELKALGASFKHPNHEFSCVASRKATYALAEANLLAAVKQVSAFKCARSKAVACPKFSASCGSCALGYNKAVKNAHYVRSDRRSAASVYLNRYTQKVLNEYP